MADAATPDLTPRRVQYDGRPMVILPYTVAGQVVYIDATHRESWFLGCAEPATANAQHSVENLRWTRHGHDPEPVTIVDGYIP